MTYPSLTSAQIKAIKEKIGHVSDDLYRFRMQKDRDPDWKSGNDEPIDDIILKLESEIEELKVGL